MLKTVPFPICILIYTQAEQHLQLFLFPVIGFNIICFSPTYDNDLALYPATIFAIFLMYCSYILTALIICKVSWACRRSKHFFLSFHNIIVHSWSVYYFAPLISGYLSGLWVPLTTGPPRLPLMKPLPWPRHLPQPSPFSLVLSPKTFQYPYLLCFKVSLNALPY